MNFYKLTDANEESWILPGKTSCVFSTNEDEKKHGIRFSSKNVFRNIDTKLFIHRVYIPQYWWENIIIDDHDIYRSRLVIFGPRLKITTKLIKEMNAEGIDLHANGEALLCWAARHDNLSMVKYLVEKCNANIHARDDRAFAYAVGHRATKCVKYLYEKGADVTAGDNRAIRWASCNGDLSMVKFLHENGSDLLSLKSMALQWAVGNGNTEVVKYILETVGVPKQHKRESIIRDAISVGLKYDDFSVLELLIDHGFNLKTVQSIDHIVHTSGNLELIALYECKVLK